MKKLVLILLVLFALLLLTTFGGGRAAPSAAEPAATPAEETEAPAPEPLAAAETQTPETVTETPPPSPTPTPGNVTALIRELVIGQGYGRDGSEVLARLRALDPGTADKWESILNRWSALEELTLNPEVLPDGLEDTEGLCLVVLGFELNPNGSMKDELLGRLEVALAGAEKYPLARIVCTGGGTASGNPDATEAGKMAEWLVENGVARERIIVEDRSLTTTQNAVNTYRILQEQYPQVRQIAVISSDYHVPVGVLLFEAQATLLADAPGRERYTVVSNAAYAAPYGSVPPMFVAAALIELAGDWDTANRLYNGG